MEHTPNTFSELHLYPQAVFCQYDCHLLMQHRFCRPIDSDPATLSGLAINSLHGFPRPSPHLQLISPSITQYTHQFISTHSVRWCRVPLPSFPAFFHSHKLPDLILPACSLDFGLSAFVCLDLSASMVHDSVVCPFPETNK